MSLVNLAHVCSHLQNASLARLGLTSIPYTRLHLSLSLLLHKQGFFSQVKVGGASPPASCFPSSPSRPDNHHVTAGPHRQRDPLSPEAALTELVYNGRTQDDLVTAGFGTEAIAFAMEHRRLNAEQLSKDGWATKAIDFLLHHASLSEEDRAAQQLAPEALAIIDRYPLSDAIERVRRDLIIDTRSKLLERLETANLHPDEAESINTQLETLDNTDPTQDLSPTHLNQLTRAKLRQQGFDRTTLAHFAGDAAYASPRHLEQDGISLSAMGLTITQQAFTPLPSQYQDPLALESEGLVTQANRASRRLWLGLKYWDGAPVLKKASLVSKPTKRVWLNTHELAKIVRGRDAAQVKGMTQIGEVLAVSTDKGVMDARECVERKIGGMPLCRVY